MYDSKEWSKWVYLERIVLVLQNGDKEYDYLQNNYI